MRVLSIAKFGTVAAVLLTAGVANAQQSNTFTFETRDVVTTAIGGSTTLTAPYLVPDSTGNLRGSPYGPRNK